MIIFKRDYTNEELQILPNNFYRIINKRDESIIWENDEFYAALDLFPNIKGATLVITKKHCPSYIFKLDKSLYQHFMLAVKEVASLLDKKLDTKRTVMIMEGTGVNHAYVKLYPLYGLQKEFEEDWTKEGGLF